MIRSTLKKRPKAATGLRAASDTTNRLRKSNASAGGEHSSSRWTFLTNHAHVLLLLARNPSIILREVATLVKITERAVQRIIADLEDEGFIEREKIGRQNHYRIIRERKLKHAVEGHRTIGDLLEIIDDPR